MTMLAQAARAERTWWTALPGISLCAVGASVALWLSLSLPGYIGGPIVAVVLGIIFGNIVGIPATAESGVAWMSRSGLRIAIILMGARVTMGEALQGGAAAFAFLSFTMSTAALLVFALGRWMQLPSGLRTLLAVGTAVCGNSAIAATAPLIKAEQREVSLAVAIITLFGTLGVLTFPVLGATLHLSPEEFGVWAGSAINDTSQVLAAGTAYGSAAADVATIVKLTRNALMAPILIFISFKASGDATKLKWTVALVKSIPLFVVAFLGMALANSIGLVPGGLRTAMLQSSHLLILAALVGIGLQTRLAQVGTVGFRPFVVGLGAAVGLAAVALVATLLTRGIWIAVFGST